jgi:glycosyltransferase involved in cell wall biosynthesis
VSEGSGLATLEPLASGKRAEFIEQERRCAMRPDDRATRRHLLELFIALGEPEDLAGASLALAPGIDPPRVAVLTPYFREPLAQLERCRRSVSRQTVRCEHIFVADGFARDELDSWPIRHLRCSTPSRNFGDSPRRIAGEAAIEAGFDAVVYLDADNWLRPRHVESLFACHLARGTPVCHSARTFHRVDGTLMPLLHGGDNSTHVDTSCLFVAAEAFDLLPLWATWPTELSRIGDRMFWHAMLARGYGHGFTGGMTTCYEATHVAFYQSVAEAPPAGVRPDVDLSRLFEWHGTLPQAERDELDRRWGFSVTRLLADLRGSRA